MLRHYVYCLEPNNIPICLNCKAPIGQLATESWKNIKDRCDIHIQEMTSLCHECTCIANWLGTMNMNVSVELMLKQIK